MNIRIKSTILVVLLISSISLLGQNENDDAVFIKLKKEYTLNHDGSVDYHYYKTQNPLTYYSINRRFGETFIVYNPDYQKLKINKAFTIMADGKKVKTPDNAFNEVLPGSARGAAAYNQLREMVVTHTGLERGSVVNLDYEIHSSKNYLPGQMEDVLLQETSPINELQIIIRVPNSKTLYYRLFDGNKNIEPEISTEGNSKVHKWVIKDTPARIYEDFRPNDYPGLPRLSFNMLEKNRAFKKFINQTRSLSSVNEQMKKIVTEISENESEKLEVLLKIQKMVVNDLKTYHVTANDAGYIARSAEETWKSSGGTELEKAILLAGLFKTAGFDAEVAVILKPSFSQTEGYSNLKQIDHFYVCANIEEANPLFFSATNFFENNLKYNYLNRYYFFLSGDDFEVKQIKKSELKNEMSAVGALTITDSLNIKGEIAAWFHGAQNPYLKLKRNKDHSKNLISGFSSESIRNVTVHAYNEDRIVFSYEISKSTPFAKEANYLFWNLPEFNGGLKSWHFNELTTKRDAPVEVQNTIEETYTFVIIVPNNLSLVNTDVNIEFENSIGKVIIKIKKSGKRIKIKRSINITKTFISLQDYPDFRKLINTWNNKKYRELVFRKRE